MDKPSEVVFTAVTTKKKGGQREFNSVKVWGDLVRSGGKCYIHPISNRVEIKPGSELGKIIILHEVVPETLQMTTREAIMKEFEASMESGSGGKF